MVTEAMFKILADAEEFHFKARTNKDPDMLELVEIISKNSVITEFTVIQWHDPSKKEEL